MLGGHRHMASLTPKFLGVATLDRRVTNEEGDVELSRPDRAQMVPSIAILNFELDAWKATPVGRDQFA